MSEDEEELRVALRNFNAEATTYRVLGDLMRASYERVEAARTRLANARAMIESKYEDSFDPEITLDGAAQ